MKYPWKKLFIRKDCDLVTADGVISTAYDILWNYSKLKKEYLFIYFKNGNLNYYIHDADEFKAAKRLYQRYFFSPTQIIKSQQVGLKFIKDVEIKTAKFKKILQKENTLKNLKLIFSEFKKEFKFINYKYSILPWWALESWQHDFIDTINKLIKKNNLESERDKILTSVLQAWKGTAIAEIQSKYQKGVTIEKLVKEYQFLRSWCFIWYKQINKEWIKSICKKTIHNVNDEVYSRQEILKLLKPNSKEKKYFTVAPYVIFFKDWRDDLRRQQAFLWNFFFEALAKYFKVKYEDMGYFTLEEIAEMLNKNNFDKTKLNSRKNHGCLITIQPRVLKVKVLENKKFNKYLKIIEQVSSRENESVIKGMVGQSGKITGRVIVIRHYKDIFRVVEGDILIANTTHPNYLMGMKKAAAFVTDEGGIASHAAIVAREMKKPCIVGTKLATKMFKDGDMVEVDANNGVIKKISY